MNPYLDYTDEQTGDPSEQLYQYYLNAAQGKSNPYWAALVEATADRENNASIPLRNASHGLLGMHAAQQSPLGKWGHLLAIPGYNLAKFAAQNMLPASGIPHYLDMAAIGYSGDPSQTLSNASPPSLESIKWGLRPFWAND